MAGNNVPELSKFWRNGKGDFSKYTSSDKESLAKYMVHHEYKADWAVRLYPPLKRQSVDTWLEKARQDPSTSKGSFYDKAGKPKKLKETVKTEIETLAKSGVYSKKELLVKTHDLIHRDAVDRGTRNDDDTRQIVSDKTITNFVSSIPDVVERSAESITAARERETRDWRNMFSWVACLKAHAWRAYPHLVMNWDATMLKFGNFISDKPGKILIEREKFNDMKDRKQTLKVPKTDIQQGASNLGVFVKKYFLSNSFGQLAEPVYLIEDTSLRVEECYWYKIPGLSSSNQVGGCGFLAFCPTRCGNKAFFKLFIDEVVLPFVKDIQASIQTAANKVINILIY